MPQYIKVGQDGAEIADEVTAQNTRHVSEHDAATIEEQDAIGLGDWCVATVQSNRQTTPRMLVNKMSSGVIAQPGLVSRLLPIGLDAVKALLTRETIEELGPVVYVEIVYELMRNN